jgi:hypothetical protein
MTTRPDSTITAIQNDFLDGRHLTSISALNRHHTICLNKYVSDLRLKFGLEIRDKWIELDNGKRVKEYWVDPEAESESVQL